MLTANRKKWVGLMGVLLAGLALFLWWPRTPASRPALLPETYTQHREVRRPHRGRVFDRKDSLLAYTERRFLLSFSPRHPLDSARFNRLLGWPDSALQARVVDIRRRELPMQIELTSSEADTVRRRRHEWPYLTVREYTARTFTVPVAAPVLGYAYAAAQPFLYQAQRLARGRFYRLHNGGVESYYNGLLTGRRGAYHPLVDALGRPHGSWAPDTVYRPGQDLHLSLDTELQAYAERILAERRGYIVALEPATGEILCYVSAPTYDPAVIMAPSGGRARRALLLSPDMPLLNRPATMANPPGSVFKLVNAAVAMQLGAITANAAFPCDQSLINCVHHHPNARNLTQALKYSCNPYFYRVLQTVVEQVPDSVAQPADTCAVRHLNVVTWTRYVKSFGLDTLLGVDVARESPGFIPTAAYYDRRLGACNWTYRNIYSLSVGQGEINLTGLQTANVLATIANRGWYITPHFVRAVGASGVPLPKFREKHRTLVDSVHFAALIPGMVAALGHGGTADLANLADVGISVAGKTGTVQNDEGDDHATFAGFAPANKPKIVVAVYIENAGYGGLSAAPCAALIMEKYLRGKIAPKRKRWEGWLRCGNLAEQGH
ncbi:peptidoglycan D,D-transpeptidase FtsI family protein [Hymenobacter sedentarius]|uniref:peptidoglycan D,D-transpeptidase FtsI family protein n=1 Tax=Hymenobacter sedentarius TaxID=1411621 RepID=UPI00090064CD|nr:penicillin-binding transpeptidase domain-containing protein [Hymenobacter sedentarius]